MQKYIYKFCKFYIAIFYLFISSSSLGSQDFSNVFSFGDSFSYTGTWTNIVAERYGYKYIQNENGFAIGGGRTSDLANMLTAYNTNVGTYNPNALYLIFLGPSDSANSFNHQLFGGVYAPDQDLRNYLSRFHPNSNAGYDFVIGLVKSGTVTAEQVFPITINDVNSRATLLGNFVNEISSKGAYYLVILNMFNDTLRQSAYIFPSQVESDVDRIWANIYNKAIYNKINELSPQANVIFIDNNRFIDEVTNNPSKYFSQQDITGTFRNNGFFDQTAHPTIAAQKLLAQYVTSVIESPTRVALIREIPLETGAKSFQNTKAIAENLITNPGEKAFTVDFKGNYSHMHTGTFSKKQLGFKNADNGNGELIFNYQTFSNISFGGQIAANNTKMDFTGNYGKASIKEYSISAHAIYNFQTPSFVYANIGIGELRYDINRHIPLGTGFNSQHGKTDGKHYMATIGAGYRSEFKNNFALLPYVSANYQQVTIKSFTEKGETRSTRMSFNIPKRISTSTEIGANLESKFIVKDNILITPSLGISYVYDFKDLSKKRICGKVSDMPRSFLVPTYKVSKSSLYLTSSLNGTLNNKFYAGINGSYKPIGRVKQWSLGFSLKGSI